MKYKNYSIIVPNDGPEKYVVVVVQAADRDKAEEIAENMFGGKAIIAPNDFMTFDEWARDAPTPRWFLDLNRRYTTEYCDVVYKMSVKGEYLFIIPISTPAPMGEQDVICYTVMRARFDNIENARQYIQQRYGTKVAVVSLTGVAKDIWESVERAHELFVEGEDGEEFYNQSGDKIDF